jgi:hypothetical protein
MIKLEIDRDKRDLIVHLENQTACCYVSYFLLWKFENFIFFSNWIYRFRNVFLLLYFVFKWNHDYKVPDIFHNDIIYYLYQYVLFCFTMSEHWCFTIIIKRKRMKLNAIRVCMMHVLYHLMPVVFLYVQSSQIVVGVW